MRVVIAGAGNVGRSIARELVDNGHQLLLIDVDPAAIKPESVRKAEWLLSDACELATLEEARLERCDVAIACTGDDKVNLVVSLLAKTEFGVPAGRRAGEPPGQRVDVQRRLGRRRRGLDPADHGRAGGGGGDGRRRRPLVHVPGRRQPGRADHGSRLADGRQPRRRGRPGRPTPSWSASSATGGWWCRAPMPPSKAATSCCS